MLEPQQLGGQPRSLFLILLNYACPFSSLPGKCCDDGLCAPGLGCEFKPNPISKVDHSLPTCFAALPFRIFDKFLSVYFPA